MKFCKIIAAFLLSLSAIFCSAGPVMAEGERVQSESTEEEQNSDTNQYEDTYMGITMPSLPKIRTASSPMQNASGNIRNSSYSLLRGIDVSHWQGSIDWNQVRSAGIDFAVIKMGGRGISSGSIYEDPYFTQNLRNAKSAGVPIGIYFFSAAISVSEAQEEANYICDAADRYGIDLPVFDDYEFTSGYRTNNGASVSERTAIVNAFCQTVVSRGYDAGFYCNAYTLANYVDGKSLAEKYYTWAASYANPVGNYYSGKFDIWQYSSTGTVSGISGSVDLDYWYKGSVLPTTAKGYQPTEKTVTWSNDSCDVSETNAVPRTRANFDNSGSFTQAGITLRDSAGETIGQKSEDPGYTGTYLNIWYDLSSELGVTLSPGTTYSYEIFVVFNGIRYSTGWRSFTTNGTPVSDASVDVYRLYNPNSGEHFYTLSMDERNNLIKYGWSYEGIGWIAPEQSSIPVYRLYNANGGEHHYTISTSERDLLTRAGWKYEGISWYSDPEQRTPIYRQYNPNAFANNHNYTADAEERDWLIDLGWRDEDIGWYGM